MFVSFVPFMFQSSSAKIELEGFMQELGVRRLIVACCFGLAACAGGSNRNEAEPAVRLEAPVGELTATDVRRAIVHADFAHVTAEERAAALREFEARRVTLRRDYFPLSRYQDFPRSVRGLLQRADVEDSVCRDRGNEETMNACNRLHYMLVELERRGWCWGGSDIGADMRWVRCSAEPSWWPGHREASGPPFPEAELTD